MLLGGLVWDHLFVWKSLAGCQKVLLLAFLDTKKLLYLHLMTSSDQALPLFLFLFFVVVVVVKEAKIWSF
jgi:hypothetical protein